MAALRRRTVFAASFVMTVACSKASKEGGTAGSGSAGSAGIATGSGSTTGSGSATANKSGPFRETWQVSRAFAWEKDAKVGCEADQPFDCPPEYSCNPPPPRPIPCPAGIDKAKVITIAQQTPHECYVVPDGCKDLSCATQPVRCPWTWDELSDMHRTGTRDQDGRCVLKSSSGRGFIADCPDPKATQFTISKEDVDKPCFAEGAGFDRKQVPCPQAPKTFLSGQIFLKEYRANKALFAGKRVHVQGFYLPALSKAEGGVSTIAVAGTKFDDKLAITCTTSHPVMAMAKKDWIVMDGRVVDVPPDGARLEDCAIWPY